MRKLTPFKMSLMTATAAVFAAASGASTLGTSAVAIAAMVALYRRTDWNGSGISPIRFRQAR